MNTIYVNLDFSYQRRKLKLDFSHWSLRNAYLWGDHPVPGNNLTWAQGFMFASKAVKARCGEGIKGFDTMMVVPRETFWTILYVDLCNYLEALIS